jgi:ribosomal protein S15
MTVHLKVHRKDKHSRKGLIGMISQRTKLLQYLRRTDFQTYKFVLQELQLKDRHGAER